MKYYTNVKYISALSALSRCQPISDSLPRHAPLFEVPLDLISRPLTLFDKCKELVIAQNSNAKSLHNFLTIVKENIVEIEISNFVSDKCMVIAEADPLTCYQGKYIMHILIK